MPLSKKGSCLAKNSPPMHSDATWYCHCRKMTCFHLSFPNQHSHQMKVSKIAPPVPAGNTCHTQHKPWTIHPVQTPGWKLLEWHCPLPTLHPYISYSAFWLWSSVVSVLISVTTDISPTGDLLDMSIFAGEVSSCPPSFYWYLERTCLLHFSAGCPVPVPGIAIVIQRHMFHSSLHFLQAFLAKFMFAPYQFW